MHSHTQVMAQDDTNKTLDHHFLLHSMPPICQWSSCSTPLTTRSSKLWCSSRLHLVLGTFPQKSKQKHKSYTHHSSFQTHQEDLLVVSILLVLWIWTNQMLDLCHNWVHMEIFLQECNLSFSSLHQGYCNSHYTPLEYTILLAKDKDIIPVITEFTWIGRGWSLRV